MSQSAARLSDNAEEDIVLLHVGMALLPALIAGIGVLWWQGIDWLIEHQVLLAATESPLWTLPQADGAGLDVARIAILVAVVAATLAISSAAIRRWWSRKEGASA